MEENFHDAEVMSPTAEASVDEHGFYSVQQSLQVATIHDTMVRQTDYPDQYVSPESFSQRGEEFMNLEEGEPTPVIPQHYFEETPQYHEDGQYFEHSPGAYDNHDQYEDDGPVDREEIEFTNTTPYGHDNPTAEEYFGSSAEEKKFGMEKDDVDSQLENSVEFVKDEGSRLGQRFVETNLPYKEGPGLTTFSPGEVSTNTGFDSQSHQSPAMRGAHEILKKRRRRFEM